MLRFIQLYARSARGDSWSARFVVLRFILARNRTVSLARHSCQPALTRWIAGDLPYGNKPVVGIDVSKAKLDVALRLPEGAFRSKVSPSKAKVFGALSEWLSKHQVRDHGDDFTCRLRASGKPAMVIIGAMMRKLIHAVFGVLKSRTSLTPLCMARRGLERNNSA